MSKLCSKCGNAGPFKGNCGYCVLCQKEYYHKRYLERYAIEMQKRREERMCILKMFIKETKEKPCADCHIQYPYYVMDFDHIRGEKEFGLAQAREHNMSLERVRAEIAKCDVVCANCHRIRTFKRANNISI